MLQERPGRIRTDRSLPLGKGLCTPSPPLLPQPTLTLSSTKYTVEPKIAGYASKAKKTQVQIGFFSLASERDPKVTTPAVWLPSGSHLAGPRVGRTVQLCEAGECARVPVSFRPR